MTGTMLKGISDGPPTGQYDLCLVKWRSVVAARVHGVFQQFVGRQYFDFQKKNFQQNSSYIQILLPLKLLRWYN